MDKKMVVSPHTQHDGQMKNEKYEGLPVYTKRLGDYRVLFVIKDEQTLVLTFKLGHRRDVYE
jgi:mRNA-degrading endonuclease RelE of RelBE toxin-antitoxin system